MSPRRDRVTCPRCAGEGCRTCVWLGEFRTRLPEDDTACAETERVS